MTTASTISIMRHARLDLVGTCLSAACAIHCLAMPLLVVLLPLIGLGFLLDSWMEWLLMLGAVSLASLSFCQGFQKHKCLRSLAALAAALMCFGVARMGPHGPLEQVMMAAGGINLAAGHLLNLHLCKVCVSCTMAAMLPPGTILQTRELSLGYGENVILKGVNFTLREGDFWFFLGPNGRGKTTLLKALAGILPPLAGALDRDTKAHPQNTGYIPQRADISGHLPTTIREFVDLGLVGLPLSGRERAERLEWALQKTGLLDLQRKDYATLSEGQKRRATIARALIRKPALLLLDEPLAGLDEAIVSEVLDLLRELNQKNRLTIVFVTHDAELALREGSHAALIGKGDFVSGPVQDVLSPGHQTHD